MKTKTQTTNSLKFKTQKTLPSGEILKVSIRLDDEYHNGHEDFSITGELGTPKDYARENQSCGCIHKDILKHFPEFTPFVRLHLCDWEGSPMHSIANGFYWFQGFVPESVDTASNLGPCHGGSGSGAKSPEECRRILMESFRATEEDISALVAACPRNGEEFSHAIETLGFRARWKVEAKAATRQLERLIDPDPEEPTAPKFKSTATRRNWEPLTKAQAATIEARKASGYYDPEQVAARDATKKETARQKRIAGVLEEYESGVSKLTHKRDVALYFATCGIEDDNVIFYDHTNELCFNWSSASRLWTREEFDAFTESVEMSELPPGLKFRFQDKPKY